MKTQSKNTLVELNDKQIRMINGGYGPTYYELVSYALRRLGAIIATAF